MHVMQLRPSCQLTMISLYTEIDGIVLLNLTHYPALHPLYNILNVYILMIQVYEPTDDSNREVKVKFFARLQETVGSVATGDVLVVMGDLNARLRNVTEVWGEILGKHGELACNDNGGWLLQFCSENNLVVSNSWF